MKIKRLYTTYITMQEKELDIGSFCSKIQAFQQE